ncbi:MULTISPECIES: cation:proton antiporter [unclassified Synechococcus]|uniref:cation:proton antiporter domain-containing protein n=1 Tax=unclassified Synechococcus TaxID=2626047 RepID=UPI0020014015|nr:cation:proton antiporter [Synechococcus sp. A10-1-5-1]UPM51218.1 cation:proton antiporter [Synechococcus sp. A10-1-5-1]
MSHWITPLLASSQGLMTVPLEIQLLFIGAVYLGTLIISRFSIRIGLPAVLGVLFLGLLVHIHALDVATEEVERLQTFSLALLLFYAGLKTDTQAIRGFLKYGLALAIAGVAISTLVLGAAIVWLTSQSGSAITPGLGNAIPLGAALLVAACLGSTDAGATLGVLRQVKRQVPQKVQDLLEFESSVNDPSALILFSIAASLFTVGSQGQALPEVIIGGFSSLLQKMGSGVLVGLGFGYIARLMINRLVVDREQLLIVAISIAFMDYGCTQILGGSGFVAVYITGLLMTNEHYQKPEINHQTIQDVLLPFNTMTEISIFFIFGLLVDPNQLLPALPAGLATAAVLMLVARPLSVLVFQRLSPFSVKESLLIAWCGLRGAVPLALSFNVMAAIPMLRGVPSDTSAALLAQNCQAIVFITVMLNLSLQGLSLPSLCRWLSDPPTPVSSS